MALTGVRGMGLPRLFARGARSYFERARRPDSSDPQVCEFLGKSAVDDACITAAELIGPRAHFPGERMRPAEVKNPSPTDE